MAKKIKVDLREFSNLVLLGQKDLVVEDGVVIYSPVCPDYHFEEIKNLFGQSERVHDFDGLGEGKGIVYEKLITQTNGLLRRLEELKVEYRHLLLVADVEGTDKVILNKLRITKDEFIRRCRKTCREINRDLKRRKLLNSRCELMGKFFEEEGYDFYGKIEEIAKKSDASSGLLRGVREVRLPLHRFWFGLANEQSYERSIREVAMYASFGHCSKISDGIILCADSEVLSGCYNLLKKKKTPAIYLKGSY